MNRRQGRAISRVDPLRTTRNPSLVKPPNLTCRGMCLIHPPFYCLFWDLQSNECGLPIPFSLVPAGHTSADVSPSPSAETSGLLSLPWEVVTHIASHLPAHCVITVLPKVRLT